MVIGIDASRAAMGQRTGTEAYAYHLIENLIPLAHGRDHELRLYFNQPPPPNLFSNATDFEAVVIPFARMWTHIRLAWELSRRPPDVFFTPAHVIPRFYRRPCVATIHDLGYHYFPKAHTQWQVLYLHWSTRHNCRRSSQIIADSLATKNDLIRLYNQEPDKITVVYPGIDPELKPVVVQQTLQGVRDKYRLPEEYLLYIGTLQPRKNLVRLIEAYTASEVDLPLVLAGKAGWLAQPILKAIEAAPPDTRKRILLTGFVADEDKAALISGAQALLFPSLYEGFGFPVLEGQVCGTPVMCTNTSSLPEVAGNAALMVPPLDTPAMTAGIQRIVQDQHLRQELITAGLANVQKYDWHQAASQILAILEEVAGQREHHRSG
jgi:glycosyltransferase involved in cell wall biosynthesis